MMLKIIVRLQHSEQHYFIRKQGGGQVYGENRNHKSKTIEIINS